MGQETQSNWLPWRSITDRRGFTLIEVVISVVIVGVLAAVVVPPLMEGTKGYVDIGVRKDLSQQGHMAMERLVREIRNTGRKSDDSVCISAATTTTYTFSDVNGNLTNCNSISFTLSGTDLKRGTAILAQNVSSFQITYYTNANVPTATLSAIRRLSVDMTLTRTTTSGPESFYLSSQIYLRNMTGY